MKILLLHNNNIPSSILDLANQDIPNISFHQRVITQSVTDEDSFDEFVSKQIDEIFRENEYDLIVIPYSLSNENHSEFSGVRLGLHIRLTPKISRTPILFIGIDKKEEIARLTELGSLLFTPKVCCTQAESASKFAADLVNYSKLGIFKALTDDEYIAFINRIQILELDNYGPHAVANVWAIKRWTEMLFHDSFTTEAYEHFKYQLNFKYINAKAQLEDKRQGFNKKNSYSPRIDNIEGKKIVYIDDEVHKGWGKILNEIFTQSNAKLVMWEPKSSLTNREEVVSDIKEFIDNTQDADCFIVDLRLAEEDRKETKFKELTGHRISRYIKELNKANQVVIFTASNKIWNLKEEINNIGALGYALKESPSMNLSRNASIELYQDFVRLVRNAVRLSQLKELVEFQRYVKDISDALRQTETLDLSGIYNSIDLLLLDKKLFEKPDTDCQCNDSSREIIKSVILNQVVFVETFIKERYDTQRNTQIIYTGNKRMAVESVTRKHTEEIRNVLGHIFLRSEKEDGYNRIKDTMVSVEQLSQAPSGWDYLCESTQNATNDLAVILATAYGFYAFDDKHIKLLTKMKDIRNAAIAHHGGNIDVSFQEIRDFYINIIGRILNDELRHTMN